MKGKDYIAKFVHAQGSRHAFVLTGGACAHMIDAFGLLEDFDLVCMQHEQAGAMAAECYSRLHEGMGVTIVTSGPGATNLITGIACAWFDSIPMLNLCGQVNTFESKGSLKIRQMGFQEMDIVSMVKGITKFAGRVEKPEQLRAVLEEAVYWAKEGRQGPVLVDIPFNIQTAEVDEASMPAFVPPATAVVDSALAPSADKWKTLLTRISQAKRPVLLAGGGVKNAKGRKEFLALAERLNMPVVATWSGLDIMSADHPLYRGQMGVYGGRAANFTIQNSDLLISVGSRLDSRQTGGKYQSFAREAFRVVVDLDGAEITKGRVEASLPFCMDAKEFCIKLNQDLGSTPTSGFKSWTEKTAGWVKDLPLYDKSKSFDSHVNPYRLMDRLGVHAKKDALLIVDCGGNLTWTVQGFTPTGDQRLISAMGNSPMGYSVPAAIGAAFAQPNRQVICIIGDGGMQINLQELQTIAHYKLPIKLFILNNRGYGIIKQFQDLYLEGRHIATGDGYSCPDYRKVAGAYEIPYFAMDRDSEIDSQLREALNSTGPLLLDIRLESEQKIEPKLGWGNPIEDQLPILPREEFAKYMVIEPLAAATAPVKTKNEIN